MQVRYFNSYRFVGILPKIGYYYRLAPLANVRHEQTFVEPLAISVQTGALMERVVEEAWGITFRVTCGGFLRVFSYQHCFLQVATSFALLTVITWMITTTARYLFSRGQVYEDLIYDTSGNLGQLQHITGLPDEEV